MPKKLQPARKGVTCQIEAGPFKENFVMPRAAVALLVTALNNPEATKETDLEQVYEAIVQGETQTYTLGHKTSFTVNPE